MRYTHCAAEAFELDRARQYKSPSGEDSFKPTGLWFEVDGDWQRWCEGEDFMKERRQVIHELTLDMKGILHLSGPDELDNFTVRFRNPNAYGSRLSRSCNAIDWRKVQQQYSGIVIAPYCWHRRMELMWYYSWDCASGCVWDLSKIITFEPVGKAVLQ